MKQVDVLRRGRIAARASCLPNISELLGCTLTDVIRGDRVVRPSRASFLLYLLECTGPGSAQTLQVVESWIERLGAVGVPGWARMRTRLVAADRHQFGAVFGELAVAVAFDDCGLRIEAFEPPGRGGRLADLEVALEAEHLIIEIFRPRHRRPPQELKLIDANERLLSSLERVASGLVIEVDGYDNPRPAGEVDELVRRFRGTPIPTEFPHVMVESTDDQPVEIRAVNYYADAAEEETIVCISFPPRLPRSPREIVDQIRREREHLPEHLPGAILVDIGEIFTDWVAYRYERDLRELLSSHTQPELVASFVAPGSGTPLDSGQVLRCDPSWSASPLGRHLIGYWQLE